MSWDKREGKIWAPLVNSDERRTVEEIVQPSLKDKHSEEQKSKNRRKMLLSLDFKDVKEILDLYKCIYRSGTVNSNTVNSKFHLIRSFCEIFARFLLFHV